MAIGEAHFPIIPAIPGIRLGVSHAGVKAGSNKEDLLVIELCEGASLAGVFTDNAFCAAPVSICRAHLSAGGAPRFLVVNSGNANACTGSQGYDAALQICQSLGASAGLTAQSVLPFSTGVIGQALPVQKIQAALPRALADLSANNWQRAAKAIMTTDTRPKGRVTELTLSGGKVTIAGIAKGSGMIKPNMATMLAYVATDAAVDQAVLQNICQQSARDSFNRITVDGDTSTNDAYILMASGQSTAAAITSDSGSDYQKFNAAVAELAKQLAKDMLRDAEGATKLVTVTVKGGASAADCFKVANAVCHSPLVKTALFASDPNWGRIVAAIGYAGVEGLVASSVRVYLNDLLVLENGQCASTYTEPLGQAVFNKAEFAIVIDLAMGSCGETLWTTDLSHEYIKINAEYRS
ncbi:MAG: bifunctional glutamate N-acetyltransferase/amino-acid acetyltransferase ArgJ [Cellvibrionaceae bacterium]|nr:bifunctional glutamate N-acetyltransferase/amino-acid acetyltransferase ArgJ [Cellvibrionaceae bacterium]